MPDHAVSLPVRTWTSKVKDGDAKVGDRVEKYGQVLCFVVVVVGSTQSWTKTCFILDRNSSGLSGIRTT